jgi:hypothetical protein
MAGSYVEQRKGRDGRKSRELCLFDESVQFGKNWQEFPAFILIKISQPRLAFID